jgi:hypothetical protein
VLNSTEENGGDREEGFLVMNTGISIHADQGTTPVIENNVQKRVLV